MNNFRMCCRVLGWFKARIDRPAQVYKVEVNMMAKTSNKNKDLVVIFSLRIIFNGMK